MGATKARTSIWSAQSLTAGAGNTNGSWIDLSAGYGAAISIQLTNGGTGPTIAAQVQIQVADNYNAGAPTLPVNFGGPLVGGITASEVDSWSIAIPPGVAAVRLVAGSNTGQAVTVDADISQITGI
jgi:hypothetical protein